MKSTAAEVDDDRVAASAEHGSGARVGSRARCTRRSRRGRRAPATPACVAPVRANVGRTVGRRRPRDAGSSRTPARRLPRTSRVSRASGDAAPSVPTGPGRRTTAAVTGDSGGRARLSRRARTRPPCRPPLGIRAPGVGESRRRCPRPRPPVASGAEGAQLRRLRRRGPATSTRMRRSRALTARRTSEPACTTAFVTSSLTRSWAARPWSGRRRSQRRSAAPTNRRATPGLAGVAGSTVSTRSSTVEPSISEPSVRRVRPDDRARDPATASTDRPPVSVRSRRSDPAELRSRSRLLAAHASCSGRAAGSLPGPLQGSMPGDDIAHISIELRLPGVSLPCPDAGRSGYGLPMARPGRRTRARRSLTLGPGGTT